MGGIGALDADEVFVQWGGIGAARAQRVGVEMGSVGAAMAREIRVTQGYAGSVLAREATIEQGFVRTLVAQRVHITPPKRGARDDRPQHVSGEVRPLLDLRGALAFGAAFGLVALEAGAPPNLSPEPGAAAVGAGGCRSGAPEPPIRACARPWPAGPWPPRRRLPRPARLGAARSAPGGGQTTSAGEPSRMMLPFSISIARLQYSVTQFMSWVTRTIALASSHQLSDALLGLLAEGGVPGGQDLVQEQDVRLHRRRDREPETGAHARRVGLDGRVDEVAEVRVGHDPRQPLLHDGGPRP